jgi:hypothetical protein
LVIIIPHHLHPQLPFYLGGRECVFHQFRPRFQT